MESVLGGWMDVLGRMDRETVMAAEEGEQEEQEQSRRRRKSSRRKRRWKVPHSP